MQPRVDGVMVNVFVIVVSAGRVKPKTIKLEFVATPLSTQQLQGVRANSCRIGLSRDNVFEWSDMSTRRLLFQWVSYHHKDDPIKHDGLV